MEEIRALYFRQKYIDGMTSPGYRHAFWTSYFFFFLFFFFNRMASKKHCYLHNSVQIVWMGFDISVASVLNTLLLLQDYPVNVLSLYIC